MSAAGVELPDRLQQRREVVGDEVLYHFANGLILKTEVFDKADRRRILPLGTPQGSLMNHLLNFPERVRGRRVFEPFAGSGPLGVAALAAGAAHVDFLDINPRALAFQRENALRNGFPLARFTPIAGDLAHFRPARRYDVILANPPFVPTPDGIRGTITSNGGPDGSRFALLLLSRLGELLEGQGSALITVFQLVCGGRPLITAALDELLPERSVEITPSQQRHIPFEIYAEACARLFPRAAAAVEQWRSALLAAYGDELTLCHYVLDVAPLGRGTAGWALRENFPEKFGPSFFVPCENPRELAFARAFENLVPGDP